MASPGFELLYDLASAEITQPQDCLLCFIHWELISRGLRCLGKGEKAEANDKESERLPNGWAANKEVYTLRYGNEKTKILLKALPVDDSLIVNVMDIKTNQVINLTLKVADFIDGANVKDFQRAFKKQKELKRQLQTELSPLLGTKEASGKHEKERERPPEYVATSERVGSSAQYHPSWENPTGNIPYGSSDLNPLGGGSGGMIFDPLRPAVRPRPDPNIGLPPGSVPPGARFEPFGPAIARRPGPDPDELKPPGYDDMFM